MLKFLFSFLVVCVVSSCTFYEPEIRGGENFKINQLNGRDIKFTAGAKIYNANGYAIKVKPSDLDVHIEGEYMGKIHLEKKVKIKRKSEQLIQAPFVATVADGAMFKALKFANKENVEVRLSGKVKAGVWFFSKKLDVNETKVIDGSKLKL